jgi:lipoprotein NlpD
MEHSLKAAVALLAVAAISGCASKTSAPVVERLPTPAAKPAPAPAPRVDARPETYTVKRGDTLYSIAVENGVDVRELAAMNNITDPSRIAVGQVLRVHPAAPAATTTETGVQIRPIAGASPIESRALGTEPGRPASPTVPGDTKPQVLAPGALKTEPKAQKLPYSEENLALLQREETRTPAATAPAPRPETAPAPKPEATPPAVAKTEPTPPPAAKSEPKPAPDADEPDRVDWTWPYNGRMLSGFSEANKGIDLAGKLGDPIAASAAGRVVYTGAAIRGYGQLVIIKHNDTYLSAYAHNNKILVKEGQTVAKGQKIAEVGATDADQPKLHFEIRRQGKPVDPMRYLPER